MAQHRRWSNGGGLHGSTRKDSAGARSGEVGTWERVQTGPGAGDEETRARATPERQMAPAACGSRFAPGGLGLMRVLDAETPELAALEAPFGERGVALARGEGRDRAHPRHAGKAEAVGAHVPDPIRDLGLR